MEKENKDIEKEEANQTDSKKEEQEKKNGREDNIHEEPYIDASVYAYRAKKKRGRLIGCIAGGLVLLFYLSGVVYFYTHFTSKTTINGYDVSGKSVAQVDALFEEEFSDYVLTIRFKTGEELVRTGDGGLGFQLHESAKKLKAKQNPFLWFVTMFCEDEYSVEYDAVYEQADMEEYLDSFDCMKESNMEPSVDARVMLEDGEAVIVPDKTGTKLSKKNVYEAVFAAFDSYSKELDIEVCGCYVPAYIVAESEFIQKCLENAENFLAIDAEYDFNGYRVKITKEELSEMAYVDSGGNIQLSRSNVELFAKNFAEKYSTSYTDRQFKTHDGRTISVYGGYYGWQLDSEKGAEELYAALSKKKSFTLEPACDHKGYAYGEKNDIGDSYVEIDLAGQHVYVYIKGKQVYDTPCVSGKSAAGMGTPGGLYSITYMATNVTLKGEDYETPVTFWMPFNGGIGMHDAAWRGSFGGEIYYYNGSHGCVNLPYSAAAEIFGMIEPGFPVICYWD